MAAWNDDINIPIEIIINILVRLPIKSIFRFKCVCKSWYVLIQSHEFFQLHLYRSLGRKTYNCSLILPVTRKLIVDGAQADVSCLCRAYLDPNQTQLELSEVALPPSFRSSLDKISSRDHRFLYNDDRWDLGRMVYGNFKVLGSCNGLVLISSGENHYAICNPAIEHEHAFKILPCIFPKYAPYQDYYFSDRDKFYQSYYINGTSHYRYFSYRVFGFGYDPVSGLYVIVYLTPKRALILSLAKDDRSWRSIDLPYDVIKYDLRPVYGRPELPPKKKVLMQVYGHGVAINNHLHWNITEFDPEVFEYSREAILSFDICNEKWGRVPVLHELATKQYIIELGILDGCLCLLNSPGITYPGLDLWIMKEYGAKESWTMLFKVPNGSGIPLFYPRDRYEFLLPGTVKGLGWFNPRDNKIRKVEFHGCKFNGENYYSNQAKVCLESFVDP